MAGTKRLGIFINNTIAQLMEFPHDSDEITSLTSHFNNDFNEEVPDTKLASKFKKELTNYFKKLGEIIKHYDEILLFGPNNTKKQLYRHLRYDKNFNNIKMDIKDSNNLDDQQQQDFVKKYFAN